MKQTQTQTNDITSLYLDYIKKVILKLGYFRDWEILGVGFGGDKISSFDKKRLDNCIAIINLSDQTVRIKSLATRNVHFFKRELFHGLTIKLNKFEPMSNDYDFMLSLKNIISDDLKNYFLNDEDNNIAFWDQAAYLKETHPMSLFDFINPNCKDRNLFDAEMLKIIQTLFLKENVEKSVMSSDPELLSLYILTNGVGDLTDVFPKDIILKSFEANNKLELPYTIDDRKHLKDLYELLFVDNQISTEEDILKFKKMFVKAFLDKTKGPRISERLFLGDEEFDGKEFYVLNPRFLTELTELQDECLRLSCEHIDKFDESDLDGCDSSEDDLKRHNERFENLQFVFKKALEFLKDIDEEPIINIQSPEEGTTAKYSFDAKNYYLNLLPDEIKMLNKFFVPIYKDIKSRNNVTFVFNGDNNHLGIFYNTQMLEKDLKERSGYISTTRKILLELEQLFNDFSELIQEENRQELELLQMDLELWKKKVDYFEKIQKKDIYYFVQR